MKHNYLVGACCIVLAILAYAATAALAWNIQDRMPATAMLSFVFLPHLLALLTLPFVERLEMLQAD